MSNNDELRDKLNELKELEDLQDFVNKYGENFRCIIKKDCLYFDEIVTSKMKINVSSQLLDNFIEYQMKILQKEIERIKKNK